MPALARGQATDCENPKLDIFTQVAGVLTDVATLAFQIFDVSDAAKQANPVQVFPATPGTRQAVDVVNLCPVGGKLSTGHFVATWTAPLTQPIGTHEIRWFFKLTATSPEQMFKEEFEILAEVVGSAQLAYCSVQDIRDEGFGVQVTSDARVATLIDQAARYIDSVTERFFEPKSLSITVDGRGSPDLLLGMPVIAVDTVEVVEQGLFGVPLTGVVDASSYRVYNRHITQGLTKPDDRDNPKISFLRDGRGARPLLGLGFAFPEGAQNIRVSGVFGYTEFDGSPIGRTPVLIRDVCKRLVVRELPTLAKSGAREDAQRRYRLLSEETRDQSYKLDRLSLHGALTGDPEIDNVLMQFKRPVDLGAA